MLHFRSPNFSAALLLALLIDTGISRSHQNRAEPGGFNSDKSVQKLPSVSLCSGLPGLSTPS